MKIVIVVVIFVILMTVYKVVAKVHEKKRRFELAVTSRLVGYDDINGKWRVLTDEDYKKFDEDRKKKALRKHQTGYYNHKNEFVEFGVEYNK